MLSVSFFLFFFSLPHALHFFRRSQDLALNLKPSVVQNIQGILTTEFVSNVENVFAIATAVSPLILLNTKQYGKSVCGRDVLLSVSQISSCVL